MKTKDSVADLNDSGQKVSTEDGKAILLNRFFSSVFTAEDLTCVPSCENKDFSSPLSEIDIVKADVAKRLSVLNPNMSPGPDGFHPRVLKELAHELSELLAMIFGKSLQRELYQKTREAQKLHRFLRKVRKRTLVITGRSVSPVLYARLWRALLGTRLCNI